jgi:hypothetical protein
MDDYGRISIAPPMPEDDASLAYEQVADARLSGEAETWLRQMIEGDAPTPAAPAGAAAADGTNPDLQKLMGGGEEPAASTVEGVDTPAADPAAAPAGGEAEQTGWVTPESLGAGASAVAGGAWSVVKDVMAGATEVPSQVVGGVVDALGEFDQFMQELVPIGGAKLFNDAGEFDPSLIGPEEMAAAQKAEETLFDILAPEDADTVTGSFVRATSQFLTGFIPGMQAMRGVQAMKGGAMISSLAAGAIADMVVFDPNEDRLSTYLNQVPALSSIVPDYLANNDPDQAPIEGRLKNAIEGAGLGLATDGLLQAFKYYKAARKAKAANKAAADPVGATVEAAKQELKQTASAEISQEIPEEALRPLGDPAAPLLIEAQPSETVQMATQRLQAAKDRSARSVKDNAALEQVNAIRERVAARKGVDPTARDPFDDLLDELRSGAVSNAKLPKRPVADTLKNLGGIKPGSSLAGDLKSRGITPKTFPGLFRRSGRETLDNIPAADHPLMVGRGVDGNGYVDQQAWIDGLEAELKGDPYRTAEQQRTFEEMISPAEDLERTLDQMGIDYRSMSNDRVKERIKEIQDAEALYQREITEGMAAPRTLEDLEREIADEAAARGVSPDLVREEKRPKVYVNHARIASAEDVRQVIQEMADMDEAAIVDKTRGTVSNAQTIKESSREYQDLTELIGRAPGPMSAAKAVAARRLLASSGEQLVHLAKVAKDANATPADLYNFRRAVQVHYAIQSEVIAARTETARALQAWSIPVGSSKARGMAINELITNQGGAGEIQDLARMIDLVADNPSAVNQMTRDAGRGRIGKALYQVWINGILSSPKTHAVNILSNSMTALWSIPERYMAAGISKAFYDGDIATGEATAQAFGLVKGIRDGFRMVYMGNKAAQDKNLGDLFDAFVQVEGTQQNAFSATALGLKPEGGIGYGIDFLGKIINAPGSALNNEDKIFKSINYRMELQALAFRQAQAEGLDGRKAAARIDEILRNPPDNLKAEAIDVAHYNTFTAPLSGKTRQILGGIQAHPKIGPVFRLVVPFVKTPTNILKYTFARTPLAYASSKIRADIAAGGARAAQAHARVAMGSMLFLTVMDIASEGYITGAGPLGNDMDKTKGVRRAARGAGAPPPYSIKIGDRWYAYNRLDPIGMLIGMGADMAETFASASEADSDMLAGAGVLSIAQNLASKKYLQGVFDFMSAIDPANTSGNFGKYIQGFAGSLTPYSSFLRNVATTADPIVRDPREVVLDEETGEVDQLASYWQTTINNVKKGIPGLSDELPPMRDLFGEPMSTASGIGWGVDFISPIASKADNDDPVTRAIVDNRVNLTFPDRIIEGVQMTAQEYDEFSAIAGRTTKEQLDKLVGSPQFERLTGGPDGMKAELIKDIVNQSREYARGILLRNNPALRDRAVAQQRARMQTLTGN